MSTGNPRNYLSAEAADAAYAAESAVMADRLAIPSPPQTRLLRQLPSSPRTRPLRQCSLPVPSFSYNDRRMFHRPFSSVSASMSEESDTTPGDADSDSECDSVGKFVRLGQRSLSLDYRHRRRLPSAGANSSQFRAGFLPIPQNVDAGRAPSVSPPTVAPSASEDGGKGWEIPGGGAGEAAPLLHHTLPNGRIIPSSPRSSSALWEPPVSIRPDEPPAKNIGLLSSCLPLLYGAINSVMCIPTLYGYASIIFRHAAYAPSFNALTKLTLLSSVVHQLCFSAFSTLPFAIGQVQDAGLLFLSSIADDIADHVAQNTPEGIDSGPAAVATAIVVLGLCTAALGLALVAAGRMGLASAVSYLPLPVIGGYLAFIGYFCLQAGVGMCAGRSMSTIFDWVYILDAHEAMLVAPGLVGGAVMTYAARRAPAALPAVMVALPMLFYIVMILMGSSIQDARDVGWVGQTSTPVGPKDVFSLVSFGNVHWSVIPKIAGTWAGMVFVVAFSSCLDVAAIAMDMGEALDTNTELVTVGVGNVLSGLTCGFTGSYIFSNTIFTYRGCRSRKVGVILAISEFAVFLSKVNFLEVSPLFFLGATLIFIGFDLVYEWIVEVRHKLLLSEYIVLLTTFVAINIIGMDYGIIFGIAIAIIDYVISTAQVSSLSRVSKRSRAVWNPSQWKMLQNHGYHGENPKIVTFEIKGSVFFGSSMQLLNDLSESINIHASETDKEQLAVIASPRRIRPRTPTSHASLPRTPKSQAYPPQRNGRPPTGKTKVQTSGGIMRHAAKKKRRPHFIVLDLHGTSHVDASASRACFLQLAKMCAKKGVCVCASGANSRVDWMLRSHDAAYPEEEEGRVRAEMYAEGKQTARDHKDEARILLFESVYEALQFCEDKIIDRLERDGVYGTTNRSSGQATCFQRLPSPSPSDAMSQGSVSIAKVVPIVDVLAHFLGLDAHQAAVLDAWDESFHEERTYRPGDVVCDVNTEANEFFIVLSGGVCVSFFDDDVGTTGDVSTTRRGSFVTGDGAVRSLTKGSSVDGLTKEIVLQVGNIFGFVDFMLDRRRSSSYIATMEGTVCAILDRAGLNRLKSSHPDLDRLVDKVLLQASIRELANV
eukprot:CAMPEP_0194281134 /NCGR_PEP_ID=MMETSP0169-20130528/19960_1 /TAXON_ID=218684 /ORGANISM="Corethron pennatum, Strain L29A3" /LENGTH=1103 /DNA_ID=CAMNT_0039026103 /DNA_START=48 /DNA_END=3355 /DNA_ORIENTATION=-